MQKNGQPAGLQLVRDTVRVLEYLARTGQPVGVRQLATELDISKSSCHRILVSLKEEDVVVQPSGGTDYRLGPRIVRFAAAYQSSSRLLTTAASLLAELSADTGETSCLYIPVHEGRMALLQSESTHPLRWVAEVGQVYPLYVGAAGKVLLAAMPEDRVERELAACEEAKGPEFRASIRAELPAIRARGVASSVGENLPSVAGTAAVILDPTGDPVASISIYGPTTRVDDDTLGVFEQLLAAAAAQLSTQATVDAILPARR